MSASITRYPTREAARQDIFDHIVDSYKRKRRHSTLGYVSPAEYFSGWLNQQKLAA
jgi:putative transposase